MVEWISAWPGRSVSTPLPPLHPPPSHYPTPNKVELGQTNYAKLRHSLGPRSNTFSYQQDVLWKRIRIALSQFELNNTQTCKVSVQVIHGKYRTFLHKDLMAYADIYENIHDRADHSGQEPVGLEI